MEQDEISQNDVIEMARRAGLPVGITAGNPSFKQVEAFAKLVDAKATAREREACAKICDSIYFENYPDADDWERSEEGEAIRDRGDKA